MGRPDDPMAVVDAQRARKGSAGFARGRRLDFPVVPCANTNFPTRMAAEEISEAMQ
jgi:5-(hydroxymethyl)furfural/furfural oxidase